MSKENEMWANIAEIPCGLYYISDLGNVKRIAGHVKVGRGRRAAKEQRIKTKLNIGYNVFTCRINGKSKTFRVARLVGEYFVPNPLKKPEINHIDANKSNDHHSNLEWVTRQENVDHAMKNNLRGAIVMPKEGLSALAVPVAQYTPDGRKIAEYESITTVEKLTGFKGVGISKCLSGILKTYKGYKWQSLKSTPPAEQGQGEELRVFCGKCGTKCQTVRPGKYQCPNCE